MATRELTGSQQRWLEVRRYLASNRHPLAVRAFARYDLAPPIGDVPLLVVPQWLPAKPIALRDVRLEHRTEPPFGGLAGTEEIVGALLPQRPDGTSYRRYSEVVADLAPPAVLLDLPTYRLRSGELRGAPLLSFGNGSYFDGLDVGEAAAHEHAAAELGASGGQPLRAAAGDPTDLARRPANLAVSALTLRHDRSAGETTMVLHRRDAAKVGHAGGLFQVLPVGVFQPTGPEPWNVTNDFSLWRLLLREYAEELLGASEDYDTTEAPYDYDGWPFGARMTAALDSGGARASVLGMGVDPLTFATDLLVAVVLDSATYDELLAAAVESNAEGSVHAAVPFTADQVERYAGREPTQAAGAALLRLAWQHRDALL